MKTKNVKKKKLITILCIVGCAIVLIPIAFWIVVFASGEIAWEENKMGPYHHAAVVTAAAKSVEVGESEYHIMYSYSKSRRQYIEKDDALKEIEDYQFPAPFDITESGGYCYALFWRSVIAYDENGNNAAEYDLDISDDISNMISLAVRGGVIYLSFKVGDGYSLYKYVISSGSLGEVAKIKAFDFVSVSDGALFVDEAYHIYFTDEEYNRNAVSSEYEYFIDKAGVLCGKEAAIIESDESGISIAWQEKTYRYSLPFAPELYPNISVSDGKIYFAVRDEKESDKCQLSYCVCRAEKSCLLSFDLTTGEFAPIKEIGEEEVFIGIGGDYSYFSDGCICASDGSKTDVGSVEPTGEYYTDMEARYMSESIAVCLCATYGNDFKYLYCATSVLKDEYTSL